MKTIKSEFIGTDATGKDFYRVIIVSATAPDSFPTSGADVDGVPDTAGIAAGSVLLTPDGNSVLYTDGWSGGGGGGNYRVTIVSTEEDTLEFILYETYDGEPVRTYQVEGPSNTEITVPAGYWLSPDFNTTAIPVTLEGDYEKYDDDGYIFYQTNGTVDIMVGNAQ